MGWFRRSTSATMGASEPTSSRPKATRSVFDFERFGEIYPNVKLTPQQKVTFEREVSGHFETLARVVEYYAKLHVSVLITKRRQLLYTDDYGKIVGDDWRKEMDYFLSNHCTFPYYTLDGRDPAREHEYRVKLLDQFVVQAQEHMPEVGVAEYHPSCTGVEFESVVAGIFDAAGADVSRTPMTGDQGIDLLVHYCGEKIAVQCKRSSTPVGNSAVQEANAGAKYYEAGHVWVVSDASFTKSARQLADSVGVQLINFRLVAELLTTLRDANP